MTIASNVLEAHLVRAADACATAADPWANRLTTKDREHLAWAFHRAESLAHAALEAALDGSEEPYRTALQSQLDDEARHVRVFAAWLPPGLAETVHAPVKRRPQAVWFAALLANEIAGFCQFQMLASLSADPDREAQVREVAADEVVHIARLVRWLEPLRTRPAWGSIDAQLSRFGRKLPGRMRQFLPRDELEPLRDEMCRITRQLLDAIRTGADLC